MRMVSKCVKLNDPQAASQLKNRSLADTLPDLKIASQRLKSIISDIWHYRGIVGLGISYASMTPRTDENDFNPVMPGLFWSFSTQESV